LLKKIDIFCILSDVPKIWVKLFIIKVGASYGNCINDESKWVFNVTPGIYNVLRFSDIFNKIVIIVNLIR
jgi:hypothetical protein